MGVASSKTYEGSCHCGAIRYEVRLDQPTEAIACNCSICLRAGWLLTFVPAAAFHLLSGEDKLTDYQFGKKESHFPFCKICGVRAFARNADDAETRTVAVNLRCLAGIDATELPVKMVDGASR